MAKTRGINTKFWSDPWVCEQLNPLDRYLFLYFLTNEHTNISGIYELSLSTLCFETGLDREIISKTMLRRLEPKVIFKDGWVVIPNFPKHQNLKSPDVVKGIQREFNLSPVLVQTKALLEGWGDGLGIVPPSSLDHGGMMPGTKPNLTKLISAKAPVEVVKDDPKPKRARIDSHVLEVFSLFGKYPKVWEANKTQRGAAERLYQEHGIPQVKKALEFYRENGTEPFCPVVNDPWKLDNKWADLHEFRQRNNL